MPGLDPYHVTNKLDDAVLDVIVTRLEARGKHPMFMGMLISPHSIEVFSAIIFDSVYLAVKIPGKRSSINETTSRAKK